MKVARHEGEPCENAVYRSASEVGGEGESRVCEWRLRGEEL